MQKLNEHLLTIDEAVKSYSHFFKNKASFGKEILSKELDSKDVVILEKETILTKTSPIRVNCFVLLLCLNGECTRSVNQFDFTISKFSLQLIPPGSIFSFENLMKETELSMLLFTENFIVSNDHEIQIENHALLDFHRECIDNIFLSQSIFTRIKTIFEDINSELYEKQDNHMLIVKLLIIKILLLLKRLKTAQKPLYSKNFSTRAQQIVYRYLMLVEEFFLEKKQISDYAKLLKISTKHLGETVKATSGKSALFYIQNRLLKEAQYLLKYTDLTMTEISRLLHFENLSEFSRFFKRHSKITPKNYRIITKNDFIP